MQVVASYLLGCVLVNVGASTCVCADIESRPPRRWLCSVCVYVCVLVFIYDCDALFIICNKVVYTMKYTFMCVHVSSDARPCKCVHMGHAYIWAMHRQFTMQAQTSSRHICCNLFQNTHFTTKNKFSIKNTPSHMPIAVTSENSH